MKQKLNRIKCQSYFCILSMIRGGVLMVNLLKQEILKHGDQCKMLSIERLKDIEKDIDSFKENEDLNDFQQYIVNDIYKFEVPDVGFDIKSIIMMAVPRPIYAKVEFTWQKKTYHTLSLASSEMDSDDAPTVTKEYLEKYLSPKGYHIKYASNMPLKRLATRSGLAVYGRNNICYVEGMGSSLTLVAYFTDIPCTEDDWTEIRQAETCSNCYICINTCPTKAIRKDRFLIDNERCLSYFNEVPGEFPEWIPLSAHHCVYDCLKCQLKCPMNKKHINHVIGPIKFSEEETKMILSERKFDAFNPILQRKVKILGMDGWLEAIPRNLLVLFELEEQV